MLGYGTFGPHPHHPSYHCDEHDRLVDRFLGDSYPVVREVFLHLGEIKDIYPYLNYLQPVADNIQAIAGLGEYIDDIHAVGQNLDKLQLVIPHLDSIDLLGQNADALPIVAEHAEFIKNVSEKIDAVQEFDERVSEAVKLLAPIVDQLNTVADHVDEIQLVGADLMGEYYASWDMGLLGGDFEQIPEITGGYIYTVGKNIELVRRVGDALDKGEVQAAVAELNNAQTVAAETLDKIDDAKKEVAETVRNAQSLIDSASAFEQNILNAVKDTEELKGEIDVLSQQFSENVAVVAEQVATAQGIKADVDAAAEQAKYYAEHAGFGFRYSANAEANDTLSLESVTPNTLLKVGDYVVNKNGVVYPVIQVTDANFTVGNPVAVLKGDKGETGQGLNVSDAFATYEELVAEKPISVAGDVVLVQDEVFVWSTTANSWVSAGSLKGVKGDDGLSANEILMDPDPVAYFDLLYGQNSGNIIGSLNIQMAPLPVEPVTIFDNILNS